jgi:pimeloyl-[acyl-carrier protein] synthase
MTHNTLRNQNDFSILSKEWIQNPYPFYDQLREQQPIYWLSSITHKGWFITGYEEAINILKDQRFRVRKPLPRNTHKFKDLKYIQNEMMLYKNPPDHTRLRSMFQETFTQQAILQLKPLIEKTVDDLLNSVKSIGTMDVIQDFAFPLPSMIIAEILGIPKEDRHKVRSWTNQLLGVIDLTRTNHTLYKGNEIAQQVKEYFRDLLLKRKQMPKEDVISQLAQNTSLTEDEIMSSLILLMIAGHETTVNLIANSILTLLTHQEQMHLLKQNPSFIHSAIEECLRFESPTQITARYAAENIMVGNALFKRGEQIYIVLGAANRDPKKFSEPNQFDITRSPNPHLAFGAGTHYCLGSQLARLEAQIAVNSFIQRFDQITQLDPSPRWRKLAGFRALKSLPVSFTAK